MLCSVFSDPDLTPSGANHKESKHMMKILYVGILYFKFENHTVDGRSPFRTTLKP